MSAASTYSCSFFFARVGSPSSGPLRRHTFEVTITRLIAPSISSITFGPTTTRFAVAPLEATLGSASAAVRPRAASANFVFMIPPSVIIPGHHLASGVGGQGAVDVGANGLAHEPDAAVAEQEVA